MIKQLITTLILIFAFIITASASESDSFLNSNSNNLTLDNTTDSNLHIKYMGNIEAGHIFLWDNFLNNTSGIVTLTTTQGVRITPYLYAGAGTGAWLAYYSGGLSLWIPIFANARATLPTGKFSPFFDLKIGHLLSASSTSFISPAIGYKFSWGEKGGVYLALGSNFLFNKFGSQWDGLNVKLGFDF